MYKKAQCAAVYIHKSYPKLCIQDLLMQESPSGHQKVGQPSSPNGIRSERRKGERKRVTSKDS